MFEDTWRYILHRGANSYLVKTNLLYFIKPDSSETMLHVFVSYLIELKINLISNGI